ncbi:thioesterase family protein [Pseudonocardia adelaidensis]|uniref:Thioesterase family protein n=1 Tax=Pseudonocardia adelaidensis TaxID=648754 RepID=A0ABP9NH94_9PSEU
MSELEPFYRPLDGPDGARFHATTSTAGPWFPDAQHVGPPSALLTRALERLPDGPGVQLARITVEVLGPVPTGEVQVAAAVERPGRSVELVAAEMSAGGRTVLRARAWRVTAGDTEAVAAGAADPLPPPAAATLQTAWAEGWLPGFIDAVEWRWVAGGPPGTGPGTAWLRQRVPLVEGEKPTPVQRLMVAADCANGVGAPLDLREWLFVNTELTVHLHRPPLGEWIGVGATTVLGPSGAGTVSALLYDEQGHTGRSAQALIVRPRRAQLA